MSSMSGSLSPCNSSHGPLLAFKFMVASILLSPICVTYRRNTDTDIAIYVHYIYSPSSSRFAHMYVRVDEIDCLGSNNLWDSSWGRLIFPPTCSSSFRGGAIWNFPCPCWRVNWYSRDAGLPRAAILLKIGLWISLLCLRDTFEQQVFWSSGF